MKNGDFAKFLKRTGMLACQEKEAETIISKLEEPEKFYLLQRLSSILSWNEALPEKNKAIRPLDVKALEDYAAVAQKFLETNAHHVRYEKVSFSRKAVGKDVIGFFKQKTREKVFPVFES